MLAPTTAEQDVNSWANVDALYGVKGGYADVAMSVEFLKATLSSSSPWTSGQKQEQHRHRQWKMTTEIFGAIPVLTC